MQSGVCGSRVRWVYCRLPIAETGIVSNWSCRMSTVFMFPGQGAQVVGMGQDLYEGFSVAREIYDRADSALGFKLSELCFSGPAEKLNATDIQQPAIFVTSVAALEAMRSSEKYGELTASYAAGLSLGEYTAYYAAGALDFESGLKLVYDRGRLMQEASQRVDSTMVAIVGLNDDQAHDICERAREDDVLVVANFNCPGQAVLSGHRMACQRASTLAEQAGAMKVVMLDVAGAFHSPLMQPAAEKLKTVLEATEFQPPQIEVIANVDCRSHTDAQGIRDSLYRQVVSPTYWSKSMQKLLDLGASEFVEIGPKKTLTGFMRRISRRTKTISISMASDVI